MSKISNALSMLFLLNGRDGYVKIQEIADHLEVGKREVRRYRDDLEMAGFPIDSQTGIDGGYRLEKKIRFALSLQQTENLMLNLGLRTNRQIIEALNRTVSLTCKMKEDMILGNETLEDADLLRLVQIQKAIEDKKKIRIEYESFRSGTGAYLVEPYRIRIEHSRYYLHAFHGGKMKTYGIGNIHSLLETEENFLPDSALLEKETAENAYGISRGDHPLRVVFEVQGAWNQYMDSYFEKKAIIISSKEDWTRYELETYQLRECLPPLLGLGGAVRVLSPESLRKMIGEAARQLLKNHQ